MEGCDVKAILPPIDDFLIMALVRCVEPEKSPLAKKNPVFQLENFTVYRYEAASILYLYVIRYCIALQLVLITNFVKVNSRLPPEFGKSLFFVCANLSFALR